MKVVILAGGRGSKLRPLTNFTPKGMIPVGGKPVLEHIISRFESAGFSYYVLTLGYKGDKIREHFSKKNNIKFVIGTGEKKGMAAGLYDARDYVKEDFIVTSCDAIFPSDYIRRIANYHIENSCDATLSISDLGIKELLVGKSCVKLLGDRVTKIIEKPTLDQVLSTVVSTPLYAFSPKVFDYIPKITSSSRGEFELQSVIQLMIDDGCDVRGLMNVEWNRLDRWMIMDTYKDYMRLNFKKLCDKEVN